MQQDLYKTAAFRAIMRARRECLAALGKTKCGGVATDALTNATRYALKLGEHTWVSFFTSDNAQLTSDTPALSPARLLASLCPRPVHPYLWNRLPLVGI